MIPFLGSLVPEAFRVCGDQSSDTGCAGRVPALACADGRLVFGRQTLPLAVDGSHAIAAQTCTEITFPSAYIYWDRLDLGTPQTLHPTGSVGGNGTVEDYYYVNKRMQNYSTFNGTAEQFFAACDAVVADVKNIYDTVITPATMPDIYRLNLTPPAGETVKLHEVSDVMLDWIDERKAEYRIEGRVEGLWRRVYLLKNLVNSAAWLGFPVGADPWFLPVTLAAENPGTFRVVLRLLLACDRETPPTNDRLFEDPAAIPQSFNGSGSLRLALSLSTTAARPAASANLRLPCLGGALFLATIESVDYTPASGVHDPIDLTDVYGTARHWRRSSGPGKLRLTLHCSEMTR